MTSRRFRLNTLDVMRIATERESFLQRASSSSGAANSTPRAYVVCSEHSGEQIAIRFATKPIPVAGLLRDLEAVAPRSLVSIANCDSSTRRKLSSAHLIRNVLHRRAFREN